MSEILLKFLLTTIVVTYELPEICFYQTILCWSSFMGLCHGLGNGGLLKLSILIQPEYKCNLVKV